MAGRNELRPVRARLLATLVLVAALLGLMLVRICSDGGAMGSAYRTCDCLGIEWQLYDRMAADGPRRTVCFGIVRSRSCFQFREGPAIACS
jgi:hypothetical protein